MSLTFSSESYWRSTLVCEVYLGHLVVFIQYQHTLESMQKFLFTNLFAIDDYGKDGGPYFTQCMIGICPLATHSYQNLELQHKIETEATIDLGRRNFIMKSTLFLAVACNKVQCSFLTISRCNDLLFSSFHQDFKKIFGLVYITD